MIKSGGEWISSIEIENVAVGHPQVGGWGCVLFLWEGEGATALRSAILQAAHTLWPLPFFVGMGGVRMGGVHAVLVMVGGSRDASGKGIAPLHYRLVSWRRVAGVRGGSDWHRRREVGRAAAADCGAAQGRGRRM